jgi:hypothetical protein
VFGILGGFTPLVTGGILAIILGIIALLKIRKSAGQLKGKGLAIAGICISVVWLFITIAVLLPAIARVRQVSFRMVCGTNLSGLGKAMLIYANDYKDMYPTPSKWCDLLVEHAEVTPKSFICKGAPEGPCSYAMNKNIEEQGAKAPPDIVLLFETNPGWNQSGGPEILSTRNHRGEGCNILFNDGYVEFVKIKDINNLKWTAEQKK